MNARIESIKRRLFGSQSKQDWSSRDSWIKRAIYWKLMALGVAGKGEDTDEIMKKAFENGISSDLFNSPPDDAIFFLEVLGVKRYNNLHKPDEITENA